MAGAADLVMVLPDGRAAWVEVKRPAALAARPGKTATIAAAGRQSDSQVSFQADVESLGHPYRIVHSVEEFIAVAREFGLGRRH